MSKVTVKPNGEYVYTLKDILRDEFGLKDISSVNLDVICNNLMMSMANQNPGKDPAELLVKNYKRPDVRSFIVKTLNSYTAENKRNLEDYDLAERKASSIVSRHIISCYTDGLVLALRFREEYPLFLQCIRSKFKNITNYQALAADIENPDYIGIIIGVCKHYGFRLNVNEADYANNIAETQELINKLTSTEQEPSVTEQVETKEVFTEVNDDGVPMEEAKRREAEKAESDARHALRKYLMASYNMPSIPSTVELFEEYPEVLNVAKEKFDFITNYTTLMANIQNKDVADTVKATWVKAYPGAKVSAAESAPTPAPTPAPAKEEPKTTEADAGEGLMFEVVPEDYTDAQAEEEKKAEAVKGLDTTDLHLKALKDGYPESLINECLDNLDDSVYDYPSFERFMEKHIDSIKEQEAAEAAKRARIKKAVKYELESVKRIDMPAAHLNTLILQHYNTSAVKALTLCKRAEKSDHLDLEVYEQSVYQLILQITQQWVSDLVAEILAAYETNVEVNDYIEDYLRSLGIPEENFEKEKASLITFLPEHLQNENSPDNYKQMKAIILIKETQDVKNNEDDYEKAILQHTESLVNFAAAYENYIDEGVPEEAAEAFATREAIDDMPEEVRRNIFTGTGSLLGKVVHMRYRVAADFNSAFREGLGEFAADYDANQERIKARKEEKRVARQQQISDISAKVDDWVDDQVLAKRERQMNNAVNRAANAKQQPAPKIAGRDPRYNNYGKKQYNNYKPDIPMWLMASGIHVLITLFIWLIFGSGTALFVGAGLLVASIGFLKQKHNEPKAGTTIILGYGVAVVMFLLSTM